MNNSPSKTGNRLWIMLTLISLAGIAVIFEYVKSGGWTTPFIAIEIALLVILIISFIMGFLKTGLWSFSHRAIKQLDERELMIVSHALRIAYAVFSVIVLFALLALSLTERSISIVAVASFILFAHLLPASIVGWSRRV